MRNANRKTDTKMKILIDNGHGAETPGKRSPDGQFREYLWAREIARKIADGLQARGHDARLIVPEAEDISLKERCSRANAVCKEHGAGNVLLVSIHCNAAGNGSQWMSARGWEAWTSVGKTKADKLATCLYDAAAKAGMKLRKDYTDGDPDKEGHLYILKHTLCPAVLTENLFMDNRDDVAYLCSDEGKRTITALHIEGITKYIADESV